MRKTLEFRIDAQLVHLPDRSTSTVLPPVADSYIDQHEDTHSDHVQSWYDCPAVKKWLNSQHHKIKRTVGQLYYSSLGCL